MKELHRNRIKNQLSLNLPADCFRHTVFGGNNPIFKNDNIARNNNFLYMVALRTMSFTFLSKSYKDTFSCGESFEYFQKHTIYNTSSFFNFPKLKDLVWSLEIQKLMWWKQEQKLLAGILLEGNCIYCWINFLSIWKVLPMRRRLWQVIHSIIILLGELPDSYRSFDHVSWDFGHDQSNKVDLHLLYLLAKLYKKNLCELTRYQLREELKLNYMPWWLLIKLSNTFKENPTKPSSTYIKTMVLIQITMVLHLCNLMVKHPDNLNEDHIYVCKWNFYIMKVCSTKALVKSFLHKPITLGKVKGHE